MFISSVKPNNKSIRNSDILEKMSGLDGEHRLIWQLFADDPDRDRDFIFRRMGEDLPPEYLIVSEREPVDEDNFWEIKTKEYAPKISEGQTLQFSLRANPTVKKNGSRHDVVMDARKELEEKGIDEEEWPSRPELAQREGTAWLKSREDQYGFQLAEDKIRIDRYLQYNFKKKRNGREVTLSSLDFNGVLEVADTEKFMDSLFNGIGPAKAYGFGLILVKLL